MDDKTAAASGSVDAVLENVAKGPFLLSLRTGRRSSAVASWLSEERLMRFQVGHLIVPLGAAFDAVAYFDRATPALRATDLLPSHDPAASKSVFASGSGCESLGQESAGFFFPKRARTHSGALEHCFFPSNIVFSAQTMFEAKKQ